MKASTSPTRIAGARTGPAGPYLYVPFNRLIAGRIALVIVAAVGSNDDAIKEKRISKEVKKPVRHLGLPPYSNARSPVSINAAGEPEGFRKSRGPGSTP
jgi:hypothetical protein